MCVVVTKITETRTCCAAAGESDSGGRPELRGANSVYYTHLTLPTT